MFVIDWRTREDVIEQGKILRIEKWGEQRYGAYTEYGYALILSKQEIEDLYKVIKEDKGAD